MAEPAAADTPASGLHAPIVIVGGGAGGLELAARLGRVFGRREGRGHVLLVDRFALHIWKPSLHEVAAGTLDAFAEGLSYPMLARRNGFSFALGEVEGIDRDARQLTLAAIADDAGRELVPERRIGFGTLVLALGSGSNFFGTPGAHHARVLEHAQDAEDFRRNLLVAFMRTAFGADRQLRIAIVGGGATGIELSAELLEAHAAVLQSIAAQWRFGLQVTIVEAGPRILPGVTERVATQATETLRQRGVDIRTETRVTELRETAVVTDRGEIGADIIVWAAGIQAAERHAGWGLEVNRNHQFVVDGRLKTSSEGIYAIGDCAACTWHGDKLVPARAQAAHQQADFIAELLVAQHRGRRANARSFRYRDFGSLVSLGEHSGVGSLMGSLAGRGFFVDGLIAKWMYMSLHLMHHAAILGVPGTALLALSRLLRRRVSGRVKLH